MSLMQDIRSFPVRKSRSQSGGGSKRIYLKSPEGTLISTDMYLTNNCADARDSGLDLIAACRSWSPRKNSMSTCTRDSQPRRPHRSRHRSRAAQQRHGAIRRAPIRAARSPAGGSGDGRILPGWPACELECDDISIRGAFALPTDDTDLNHMGYVFQFGRRPRIYMTGDTDYSSCSLGGAA